MKHSQLHINNIAIEIISDMQVGRSFTNEKVLPVQSKVGHHRGEEPAAAYLSWSDSSALCSSMYVYMCMHDGVAMPLYVKLERINRNTQSLNEDIGCKLLLGHNCQVIPLYSTLSLSLSLSTIYFNSATVFSTSSCPVRKASTSPGPSSL